MAQEDGNRHYVVGGVYHARIHGPSGHFIVIAGVTKDGVTAHVCTSRRSALSRGAVEAGSLLIGEKETYILKRPELVRHELVENYTRITIDSYTAEELGIRLRTRAVINHRSIPLSWQS